MQTFDQKYRLYTMQGKVIFQLLFSLLGKSPHCKVSHQIKFVAHLSLLPALPKCLSFILKSSKDLWNDRISLALMKSNKSNPEFQVFNTIWAYFHYSKKVLELYSYSCFCYFIKEISYVPFLRDYAWKEDGRSNRIIQYSTTHNKKCLCNIFF